MQNPFRHFNSSPAIIRLAVMMSMPRSDSRSEAALFRAEHDEQVAPAPGHCPFWER
jgi:hypothetical protein